MHNGDSAGQKYEVTDAHVKGILIVGLVLTIVAAASFVLGVVIMKWADAQEPATQFVASPLAGEHQEWTTDARLQDDPKAEMDQLRAEQEVAVRATGVLSEEPLVYRIPVDDALKIVAEHGFPDFKAAATAN